MLLSQTLTKNLLSSQSRKYALTLLVNQKSFTNISSTQRPLGYLQRLSAPALSPIRINYQRLYSTNETSKPSKTSILSSTPSTGVNPSLITDDLVKKAAEAEKNNEQEQQKKAETPTSGVGKLFSREHSWKLSLGFILALTGGSIVYLLVNYGPPKLDEHNNPIRDRFSDMPFLLQYTARAFSSLVEFYDVMQKPSTDVLLPDPIPAPYYQPTYTLVIEMTGIMLHPEWTLSTGWRYKKRPGLDYFLDQIKYPMFEVVLFTREPFMSGAPIAASLDQQQLIPFKLFRESTRFVDNSFVKDLSYMNRDVSKIIVIDWDESAYKLQPRNALHRLKKWEGDETDTDLVYLASFLKLIASSGVSDVREVLDYYNKEINPLDEFKIKQVQIKEAEMQREEELKALKQKQKTAFSLLRR